MHTETSSTRLSAAACPTPALRAVLVVSASLLWRALSDRLCAGAVSLACNGANRRGRKRSRSAATWAHVQLSGRGSLGADKSRGRERRSKSQPCVRAQRLRGLGIKIVVMRQPFISALLLRAGACNVRRDGLCV